MGRHPIFRWGWAAGPVRVEKIVSWNLEEPRKQEVVGELEDGVGCREGGWEGATDLGFSDEV